VLWFRSRLDHHPIGVRNVLLQFLQRLTLAENAGDFPQFAYKLPLIRPVLQREEPLHVLTSNAILAGGASSLNLLFIWG
jgi:hypothetical protein